MLMDVHGSRPISRQGLRAPPELLLIAGSALGLFLTVAIGAYIADLMPAKNPWLFMASFAAPGAAAFAIYWLIARRV